VPAAVGVGPGGVIIEEDRGGDIETGITIRVDVAEREGERVAASAGLVAPVDVPRDGGDAAGDEGKDGVIPFIDAGGAENLDIDRQQSALFQGFDQRRR
jgi:hypothetical protein